MFFIFLEEYTFIWKYVTGVYMYNAPVTMANSHIIICDTMFPLTIMHFIIVYMTRAIPLLQESIH